MSSVDQTPRRSPLLLLAAYAVGASAVVIFQRYLSFHFDQFTQNFFRFLTGAICMLVLCLIAWPGEVKRLLHSRRGMAGVGLITLGGLVAQALFVEGVGRTSAVLAGVIPILGVPLSTAAGALLFADERRVVRGPGFRVGAPLALAGAVLLALGKPGTDGHYASGVHYLLGATLVAAGLVLVSKRMVLHYHPVCVTTFSTSLMSVGFLAGALLWGHPEKVLQVPPVTVGILLFSGAYGLMIGGALYYVALKRCGMVLTSFTSLATPVFSGVLGYLLFRESLTPREMLAAAVLLVGCTLVVTGKTRGEAVCDLR